MGDKMTPEGVTRYVRVGQVYKHILIAEKALGKHLPHRAEIHHVNGTKNSGPLVICQDRAYHLLLHRRTEALYACGHASWRKCTFCQKYDDPTNMYIDDLTPKAYHRECHNRVQKNRRHKRQMENK